MFDLAYLVTILLTFSVVASGTTYVTNGESS